ncbi:hypothetical protein LTR36_009323 [Oleoguttula mirabilis]|uniref:Nucleotide sugar dehydrogenase n=1 Tax=Oleoguttula mirabilis TaxID=1507867 RepID=A0AAV9J676_9PEZI|nr:hypothetical protein LTR36_009323 [Oleoguttula mirabilis]
MDFSDHAGLVSHLPCPSQSHMELVSGFKVPLAPGSFGLTLNELPTPPPDAEINQQYFEDLPCPSRSHMELVSGSEVPLAPGSFGLTLNGLPTPPPDAEISQQYFEGSDVASLEKRRLPSHAIVAVIGVGFVGFQLACAFGKVYEVIAFDIDPRRLLEVHLQLAGKRVRCTSNPSEIAAATHFLISVPTGLYHDKTVDTRHLESAIALVAEHARPGSTVIIESSVAVGMTRQLMHSVMLSKSLKAGMSPERVDPGRTHPTIESIPKIISGLDELMPESLASIQELYQEVFKTLVPVSSPEVAEMTKLYENCQRMVCIAHANEMADACETMGIDAREVSAAAATKPFGYQPYTPGLGVGGHCILVNPYYLLSTSHFPLLEAATQAMATRPSRLGDRTMKRFTEGHPSDLAAKNSPPRVLVVGVAFKRGESVLSNSPGVALIRHLLSEWQVYVEWVDPLVSGQALSFAPKLNDQTDWNVATLKHRFDIIIIALDQVGLDLTILQGLSGVLVERCATETENHANASRSEMDKFGQKLVE